MKKINYKVGDIVELADGVHYKYLGLNQETRDYLYEPVEPQSVSLFFTLTDKECEKRKLNKGTVPFAWKMDVNVTKIEKL